MDYKADILLKPGTTPDDPQVHPEADSLLRLIPEINAAYCALKRLGKAAVDAELTLGSLLAEAERRLQGGWAEWIHTRVAISVGEAHACLAFFGENNAVRPRLSPAVAFPLSELLPLLGTTGVRDSVEGPPAANEPGPESPECLPQTPAEESAPPSSNPVASSVPRLTGSQRAALAVNAVDSGGDVPDGVNRLFFDVARQLRQLHPLLFEKVLSGELSIPQAKERAQCQRRAADRAGEI